MDEWNRVKDVITPSNLIRLGDPSYATLAACLGLLDEYSRGPEKAEDNTTKLNELLNLWRRRQTEQDHLLHHFIETIEEKQSKRGDSELNSLIAELKKLIRQEEFLEEIPFPEDAVHAVTRAVKECAKRDEIKFKFNAIKDAILEHVFPDFYPEDEPTEQYEIEFFNGKCLKLSNNGRQFGIRIFVKELKNYTQPDCLKELCSKQNEHVIVDRKERDLKPTYMYVVHQFDKLIQEENKSYESFFLCYGGDRMGERENRWPEIPFHAGDKPPPKLYSIRIKILNPKI